MELPRSFYFWGLTVMGSLALLAIAARFWWPPAGIEQWDYLELGLDALLVVVIWIAYRRHSNDLGKLTDRVGEDALTRLSSGAYSPAFLAYLFLFQRLNSMHRY